MTPKVIKMMLLLENVEQRTYLKYCNGAETFYAYAPARRRLQNLTVNAKAGTIMDNAYSYDAVSNVLGIKNNAPLPQSGKAGGQMSHSYSYDPLYRLASATGTYAGANSKTASYTLAMGYDNMHRITSKKQHLSQTGVQFEGTLNAGYDLTYTYQDSTGHKFQLANVRDINYRTEETPTDSTNINNGHKYIYDANGNLVYINTSRVKRDGKEDDKATEQKYRWDEENRLLAADENYSIKREQSQICLSYAERENNRPKVNGFVSNYWYDADGERTVKTSGENEAIYVNYRASRVQCQVCLSIAEAQPIITESNSEFSGGNTGTARFSLYGSPYLVAGQGGKYTKHIYVGSQRIVSKLGDLASYGADPRRIPYAGNEADGLTINYKDKYNQQLQSIKDNYKAFDQPYNGKDNDDYVNGQGFCCDDGTPEAAQARAMARTRAANDNFHDKDNYEKMQFYYHPDHLGSSSYITNLDGEVAQHIEYVPFGEVFIEERNNTWNTPYLFNAKEFDEETGMYYYGARYYESRVSLWMSTDPMEKNMPYSSTYTYCHNNPINRIDENGLADYFSTSGKFIRSDGNDKDPYIYIQTRKGNVILSDYNFGNYKSGGLRKMMRIVYHYAKKTGATQHATAIGVDASTPKGTDANTLAYTLNDKIIRVLVKKGYFNKKLSQIYNMSSTLSHENFHTQIRGKSREEEIQVIMRQMQAPEFKKTTASFKEGTAGYLQKELQKLYKENNRIFNKYIEKASELLKANGVNSVPTYLNGGNEIQF